MSVSKLNSERDPYDALAQHLRDVIREEVERAVAPKPYLTVAETAELLTVSESSIRSWIKDGTLPASHIGGRTIIERVDIEKFVEERKKERR